MPKADVSPLSSGPGWGCSCRAWRPGEPTPERVIAALPRWVNVTVEDQGWHDGTRRFKAWTRPESQYFVTYDPVHDGGWCKHVEAAEADWFGEEDYAEFVQERTEMQSVAVGR